MRRAPRARLGSGTPRVFGLALAAAALCLPCAVVQAAPPEAPGAGSGPHDPRRRLAQASLPQRDAPPGAAVELVVQPAGAEVLVDGTLVGTAPLTLPPLAPGKHTVLVRKPGYAEARRTLEVGAGAPRLVLRVALTPLASHLLLGGGPPGAAVLVDGKRVGVLPLAGPVAVAPGLHVVRLEKPGFASAETRVTVAEGEISMLSGPELRPATPLHPALQPGAPTARSKQPPGLALALHGIAYFPVGGWMKHPYAGRIAPSDLDYFGPGGGLGLELMYGFGRASLVLRGELGTLTSGAWESYAARNGSPVSVDSLVWGVHGGVNGALWRRGRTALELEVLVGYLDVSGRETDPRYGITYPLTMLHPGLSVRARLGAAVTLGPGVEAYGGFEPGVAFTGGPGDGTVILLSLVAGIRYWPFVAGRSR